MRSIFTVISLISVIQFAYSQVELPKVIPPSPDIAALTRYAEVPVDKSTGVPEISIPIYTIKAGKISLPISMSYHAGGIKVRDIASVVGLGWSLNAGGAVARTVLGRRDESGDFISPYKTIDDLALARSAVSTQSAALDLLYHYQNMSKEQFETQSDRYAYNFNGKSGVFRYDWNNGNVHLVPYAPLKIEKKYINNVISPLNLFYVITDVDGTKYSFEAAEATSQSGFSPTTAWNLTKIISADQKDQISLFYSGGEVIVQPSEIVTVVKNPGISILPPVNPSTIFTRTPIGSQYAPKRLDSIISKDCIVKFNYSTDRQDGRQNRLTNITIRYKASGSIFRKITLGQSYFGTSGDHTLRLRMDNLQIQGSSSTLSEQYSFNYNNNVPPGYYMTSGYLFPGGSSFPASISEDYWGFSGGGSGIPSEFLGFLSSSELSIYGGNRNPNSSNMQDCILQQINYPSGGHTVFEFESNKTNNPAFYQYSGQVNANGGVVGGLRIKTIKNYSDANTLSSQKSYTYDAIGAEQGISSVLFSYRQPIAYYTANGGGGVSSHGIYESNVALSSSSYPLSIMNSSPVIYSQVSEYQGTVNDNIGKTVFTYQIPIGSTLNSSNLLGSPKFLNGFTLDRGSTNPLLSSETVFKNSDGNYSMVSRIENKYSFKRANEFLTGIRINQEIQFRDLGGYYSPDSYDTPYVWDYLNSYSWEATKGYEDAAVLDTVINSDYSNLASPVVQITSYKYDNNDHHLATQKLFKDSKGDNYITQYRYPHDFIGTQPYTNMVNNTHQWNQVIEQNEYKNTTGNFLQSTRNNYADWGTDLFALQSISTKTRNEPSYTERIRFYGYDTYANPLSVSKDSRARISYIWGYRGLYPIAEVVNALPSEIAHTSFEQKGLEMSGDWQIYPSITEEFREELVLLRYKDDSHTGLLSCNATEIESKVLPAKNYQFSMYAKGTGNITVNGITQAISGNWQKYSWILPNATKVTILNINAVLVDDLSVYPIDAQMRTFTYTPLVGISSSTDTKGYVSYYEYDFMGRLNLIRDQNKHILKKYEYHLAGQ